MMRLLLPTDKSEGIRADRCGWATEFRKGVRDAALSKYFPKSAMTRTIARPRRQDADLTPVL